LSVAAVNFPGGLAVFEDYDCDRRINIWWNVFRLWKFRLQMADEEDLESLLARHKKEQKALVSQITSLKKTVTKGEKAKRKEVLVEVEQLEKGLRDRHQQELQQIKSRGDAPTEPTIPPAVSEREEESVALDFIERFQRLKLDEIPTAGMKNTGGKTKMNRQAARLVNPSELK